MNEKERAVVTAAKRLDVAIKRLMFTRVELDRIRSSTDPMQMLFAADDNATATAELSRAEAALLTAVANLEDEDG